MPKISIIIPCYNYGRYIMETLDSVWQQTFRDYEVLIVDDGSTDAYTLQILREIETRFPDVQIVRQKNGGPAKARNMGVKNARGEFFLPLDADDIIHPQMLARCFAEIQKDEKIGMVYTDTMIFGDFNGVLIRPEFDLYRLLIRNFIVVSSLIRKKAWEDVGGYDENMCGGYEDWEFYIRLSKIGYEGRLIKEPLFFYREHGMSKNKEATEKHEKNVAYIRNKHADLYAPQHLYAIEKKWHKLNRALYWQPIYYVRAIRMIIYLARRYGWKRMVRRVIKN